MRFRRALDRGNVMEARACKESVNLRACPGPSHRLFIPYRKVARRT
jgi:hypothetical protein